MPLAMSHRTPEGRSSYPHPLGQLQAQPFKKPKHQTLPLVLVPGAGKLWTWIPNTVSAPRLESEKGWTDLGKVGATRRGRLQAGRSGEKGKEGRRMAGSGPGGPFAYSWEEQVSREPRGRSGPVRAR